MKINWNEKYNTIATYSFIVIASSILFFLIMSSLEGFNRALSGYLSVLNPFIYGFVIAYLVNFIMNFAQRNLLRIPLMQKVRKSRVHGASLLLAYAVSAFFIYLFLAFILPQLVSSISGLVGSIPDYIRNTSDYLENVSADILLPPEALNFINDRWEELSVQLTDLSRQLVPMVLALLRNTALSVWNVVLGIIISIYMLAEKNRFISVTKKLTYGFLPIPVADKTLELTRRTQKIFSDFLGGKILDSIIIGILAFIIFSIVNMPYTLLVTFIITVTNVVPFFGPFIGAIPSVIIIFFESPVMAFWFLVIILALQQLDGNVIGPKILGDSLGISSFWILFAILVGGKIFGFIGLIIGVPLFVLIYSIVKELVEFRLAQKNLPVETDRYLDR